MKFVNVIAAKEIPDNIARTLQEQPARSGQYNWLQVFKGEIQCFDQIKERLDDYDVITVNMAPSDHALIPEIRARLRSSSTRLVVNNDYVTECWPKWDINPDSYRHLQAMGDMVFTTEAHQASWMIPGTFTMPHPTNTGVLKHFGTDFKDDAIASIFHWWHGDPYHAYQACKIAKDEFGIARSKLYAYNESRDKLKRWNKTMFDTYVPIVPFPDYLQSIMGDKLVYDPNPYHTYGRNGVEFACTGTPVVGSNRVFSYNYLFPELTCDPFDLNDTMKKFSIVMNEEERTKQILADAAKKVEYFNYKNSKKRFTEALQIASDRGGYEYNQRALVKGWEWKK